MEATNYKAIATDFLTNASAGNAREVFKKYAAENFKHHNIHFKGDAITLMEAMEEAAKTAPQQTIDIKRILQDGDTVAAHSLVVLLPGGPAIAVVHIFRFENGKIAELWDIIQPIPDDIVNENGAF